MGLFRRRTGQRLVDLTRVVSGILRACATSDDGQKACLLMQYVLSLSDTFAGKNPEELESIGRRIWNEYGEDLFRDRSIDLHSRVVDEVSESGTLDHPEIDAYLRYLESQTHSPYSGEYQVFSGEVRRDISRRHVPGVGVYRLGAADPYRHV